MNSLPGERACQFIPFVLEGPLRFYTLARGLVKRDSFLLTGYALQPSIPGSGALRLPKKLLLFCRYFPDVRCYGDGYDPIHLN